MPACLPACLRKTRANSAANNDAKPQRIPSPVTWFGGKGAIWRWIVEHFPEHRCYVEPFGGGASVLLNKPPAKVEIYNDRDARLVALFDVLRRPQLAKRLAASLALTPYSEAEFYRAWNEPTPKCRVERARRVVVALRMSFGGYGSRGKTPGFGFACKHNQAEKFATAMDHLDRVVQRLRGVQVMGRDAVDVVRRFDGGDTLFYVDPPYVPATRKTKATGDYQHELTEDDHVELARALNAAKGKVVLSGYPSDLYARLYRRWRTVDRRVPLRCTRTKGQWRVERLWMNF